MNNYITQYATQAQRDLKEIYEYIAYTLRSPASAERKINKINLAIKNLNYMPERNRLYDKGFWRGKGLRYFSIERYSIFYFISKETKIVTVIRIIYASRNIERQLNFIDF